MGTGYGSEGLLVFPGKPSQMMLRTFFARVLAFAFTISSVATANDLLVRTSDGLVLGALGSFLSLSLSLFDSVSLYWTFL